MTSAPAIGFEYRPSRWLGRALLPVSLLAMLALWLSAVPLLLKLLVSGVLIISVWRAIGRFVHSPVIGAGYSRDNGWSLRTIGGEDVPATLRAFRVLGEKIIWLQLRAPGLGNLPLLLAPDNSDADIRRRLRMRLALAAAAGTLSSERGPTV